MRLRRPTRIPPTWWRDSVWLPRELCGSGRVPLSARILITDTPKKMKVQRQRAGAAWVVTHPTLSQTHTCAHEGVRLL
jgi:hypothetical protein